MGSEVKIVEQRLKSFTAQLHTECGILERVVYKHKNQHRRCSYFQYILKVRRDLQLLKSANLEEVVESCFLVINGDRPKQKVQLLEGLKRRKTGGGKYNFLDRLLGVTRLLSQIVEPLLKAAMYPYYSQILNVFFICSIMFDRSGSTYILYYLVHLVCQNRHNQVSHASCFTPLVIYVLGVVLTTQREISTLLARSFFMKFSLAILAVLARIRVLVQQMLLDSVHLYNTVSSLSKKEQSIKLKQDGFEVFREYFPKKEEARIFLECIWEKDKFVLVEKTHKSETASQDTNNRGDPLQSTQQILYENMEVILGDESVATASAQPAADTINVKENCMKKDEKDVAEASTASIVSSRDASTDQSKLSGDESCSVRMSEAKGTHLQPADSSTPTLSYPVRREKGKTCSVRMSEAKGTHSQPADSSTPTLSYPVRREKGKKVAFVAVKPPALSTTDRTKLHSTGTKRNEKDPFFDLLTSGNKSSFL